jgi:acetyl esterase
VLHFHGGTFVCGDLDNGRTWPGCWPARARWWCRWPIRWRPQSPFPDAIEVGYEALEWLYKQRTKLGGKGAQVYLAGEEAGGNLAAAVALIARDRPIRRWPARSCCRPCSTRAPAPPRCARPGDAPTASGPSGWQKYLRCPSRRGRTPMRCRRSFPRLAALAPALVLVGQDDPMRDEAMAFANRLRGAGIAVTSSVLPSAANWPKALYDTENTACVACEATVQRHFREFFSATTPPGVPSTAPSGTAPNHPS